ncbi:MAG: phosphate acyltransferase PlsX [Anaerolineae bacterium]|nr:phosphate acyltransferase PlsX [Anaerolineae bacterium]
MRIVVDAMGSDNFPMPDVEGAVQAARLYPADDIVLVGDQTRIQNELKKYDTQGLKIEIVHTTQNVTMEDHPGDVGRTKKDSSMLVGMNLVRDGKADAFVTAGNTGAALAIATLHSLRRIPGVKRPALTSLVPTAGETVALVDLGANTDCKADWLVQFGIMANVYAQRVMERHNPSVALLSNGEEESKGNALVKEAGDLLRQTSLNFVGNVEPKDMMAGKIDVVVADGFVGNICIKSMEAVGSMLFRLLQEQVKRNPLAILGALLMRPALRSIYHKADPFEIGGAPLLGVNGVVIIGHGRSNAKGIKNAIGQARKAVQGNLIAAIREGMTQFVTETHEVE